MSVLISDVIDVIIENIDNYKICILCGKRIRKHEKILITSMYETKIKSKRLKIIDEDLKTMHHSIFPLRYDNYTIIIQPLNTDIHVKIVMIINTLRMHDKKATIIIDKWDYIRSRKMKYILKPSDYNSLSKEHNFEIKNFGDDKKIIYVNK